jgi:hypothetical protein
VNDAPYIDWKSATVDGGRLTVPLAGERTSDWTERVEHVLERLDRGSGGWGEIAVGKKKLKVESVRPGSEADLRHLLESAIQEANADLDTSEEQPADERSEADQEMTDAFRAFADA